MPALTGEQLRYFARSDKNFFEKIAVIVTKITHHWAVWRESASKPGGMIEKLGLDAERSREHFPELADAKSLGGVMAS